MAFYLTPPSGVIQLYKLSDYTITRFHFLSKVFKSNGDQMKLIDIMKESVELSDCLLEGSVKDKISHFMLRVICSKDRSISEFFILAETLLFEFRFSCMSFEELHKLFKSLDLHTRCLRRTDKGEPSLYSPEITNVLKTFYQIKRQGTSWRHVVDKYLLGSQECFSVPFYKVLPLVRTREVVLNKGDAFVPYCKLRKVAVDLFNTLMKGGIKQAQSCFQCDDRFLDIFQQIKVQYTLFLKEAGMSVHDAICFWRNEYSKPALSSEGCSHDWKDNESRYTYGIRHLYGLEGSRINYKSHTCHSLQDRTEGVSDQGGCPFAKFDKEHLQKLLYEEGIEHEDDIVCNALAGQFNRACSQVLCLKLKVRKKMEHSTEGHSSQSKYINDAQKDLNLYAEVKVQLVDNDPSFSSKCELDPDEGTLDSNMHAFSRPVDYLDSYNRLVRQLNDKPIV
ncbi:PRI2-like protein [Mya arenaria]|uniref:PRI2-like protein n=1 Tax=Mya arenaria TaxID=6604 RepID=A0ABY7E6W9_MYAAR|nr:PRI2-like protein [Mya arenaria]